MNISFILQHIRRVHHLTIRGGAANHPSSVAYLYRDLLRESANAGGTTHPAFKGQELAAFVGKNAHVIIFKSRVDQPGNFFAQYLYIRLIADLIRYITNQGQLPQPKPLDLKLVPSHKRHRDDLCDSDQGIDLTRGQVIPFAAGHFDHPQQGSVIFNGQRDAISAIFVVARQSFFLQHFFLQSASWFSWEHIFHLVGQTLARFIQPKIALPRHQGTDRR